MKKLVGVLMLASAVTVQAETHLSCDIDEIDQYTGEVIHSDDVKVVVPDQNSRKKHASDDKEFKSYEEWVINPKASIYRFRGKLDGELVTLEKSMIEAGTGIVRGEIRHKELEDRPRKQSTYEGRCYLDQ
ncbi:MAG: hypothetical protein HON68_06265 [Gammaproteobacteria bacterium]|jgi:hypothetical protein|nr:hypothetical protein [Gammaproteobacteria bacterium]MBT3488908.1 hypothetical protein [Gammaproteobacteria bacterium]MBT3718621.1 hypothetical protein [Gammaproteobacteria bacterium]MBT3844784.1 hypothetical protein [Gammaproteobacteria bacterium]MBT3892805.1 hypothetical protein [Gammaproteobacteria bacterium]